MIHRTAQTVLDTEQGTFDFYVYQDTSGKEHMVLVKGWGDTIPLVRIHSKCATGDIFGSVYCDCRAQLHEALKLIQEQGGMVIYLDQEGRGLGLSHKIMAYELQRQGLDTVEADEQLGNGVDVRNYKLAGEMLKNLGVHSVRLLTNNPKKVEALEAQAILVERVGHVVEMTSERGKKYLRTKAEKLGHEL